MASREILSAASAAYTLDSFKNIIESVDMLYVISAEAAKISKDQGADPTTQQIQSFLLSNYKIEAAAKLFKKAEEFLKNCKVSLFVSIEAEKAAKTALETVYNNSENKASEKKELIKTVDLAFYTVFITSDLNDFIAYHSRVPSFTPPSTVHDCYFYTNSKHIYEALKDTKWIPILLEFTLDSSKSNEHFLQDTLFAKHIKAMPHLYKELTKYEYTFYFDATVKKINVEKIEQLATSSLRFKINPSISYGVIEELHQACLQPRYAAQREQYETYIEKQLVKGLTAKTDTQLLSTFILRKMNDPEVIRFNEVWHEHILECGIECQIALFFVAQLFPGLITEFDDVV
jgi:hypothetical protein